MRVTLSDAGNSAKMSSRVTADDPAAAKRARLDRRDRCAQ
jgi:hypothetical protein